MEELLRAAMPHDVEMVDLIERAFLEEQIDGQKADLAYLWLQAKQTQTNVNCYPHCYPKYKGLHQ
jgi:hypothetical protein